MSLTLALLAVFGMTLVPPLVSVLAGSTPTTPTTLVLLPLPSSTWMTRLLQRLDGAVNAVDVLSTTLRTPLPHQWHSSTPASPGLVLSTSPLLPPPFSPPPCSSDEADGDSLHLEMPADGYTRIHIVCF